jgi:hypothetical protein
MSQQPVFPVMLRTTTRPLCRAARPAGAIRAASQPRAALFAAAILGRYTARLGPWWAQSLEFRQIRPAVAVTPVHQHSHTHLAPHLEPAVVAWPAAQPGPTAGEPSRPASRLRSDREVRTLMTVVRGAEPPVAEQLVRRLLARGRRVEAAPSADRARVRQGLWLESAGDEVPAVPVPAVRPVPRILRQAAPADVGRAAMPGTDESERPAHREEPPTTGVPPRPPDPAIDLNRLTDEVIQAIDRRIVAQRERLGRI